MKIFLGQEFWQSRLGPCTLSLFFLSRTSAPHGNLWFYVSRTHIFKESRKGQNTDSGLVFDFILGSVLVIGGPCCAFLLLFASFCRCSKKVKIKHGYDHDWRMYLPAPRLVGRGGAISKDILKFARWPHCRRNTAKNTAKNAEMQKQKGSRECFV